MAIVRIQLRRDTAADWTSANPILAEGEMGIETDTDLFKIGDGSTAWTSLGYGGLQGVTNATAPITYDGGTQTVGIDESAISITASQISDVTATAAELNILDGVTATAAELNTLDGITATVTELNYTDGVTSAIQTQLDSKAPLAQSQNAQSTNYTLQASDNGNIVKASGTITITVPDAVFSAGERVDVINEGSGVITFAAGSGFTILSKDSALTLDAQYKAATLVFETASQAFLIGDIA